MSRPTSRRRKTPVEISPRTLLLAGLGAAVLARKQARRSFEAATANADQLRERAEAAAEAAVKVGLPYVYTGSFDTAGKTMMGLHPKDIHGVAPDIGAGPLAVGANCGVGASDILQSLLDMTGADPEAVVIVKGNCGIPEFRGTEIFYSIQGNILRAGNVMPNAVLAFNKAAGSNTDRVMAAMEAADGSGGDSRCRHSLTIRPLAVCGHRRWLSGIGAVL